MPPTFSQPLRPVIVYMVEAYQGREIKGCGYVIRDGFMTTRPILGDGRGNALVDEEFELRITNEIFCCINNMVH